MGILKILLCFFLVLTGAGASEPSWQVIDPLPGECMGSVPLETVETAVTANFNSDVTALAWSDDGQRLASISGFAGQIDIWNRELKRVQQIKVALGIVGFLAFTHDGQFLVTSRSNPDPSSNSVALDIWDLATGKIVRHIPGPVPDGTGHDNRSEALAISADGRVAGSLATTKFGAPIELFDTTTWQPLGTISVPMSEMPRSFAFSKDGEHIAVGTVGGKVIVYNTKSQQPIITFQAYVGAQVLQIQFSPDGSLLATGPWQGLRHNPPFPNLHMVHVWRAADGALIRTYEGNFGPVRGLSWSPDGRFVATGITDGPARIWTVQRDGPPCITTNNYPPRVWPVSFSPDGKFLAAGGRGGIILFKIAP